MCKDKYAAQIDRAVFPGMQGGPHDHITAGKAVAFGEALTPEFKEYAKQVIANANTLAQELNAKGFRVVSGGTDNHLLVADMTSKGLSGLDAENVLNRIGISVSRSTIPNDPNPPMNPSGVRFGTPALTTRGMKEAEVKRIAEWIDKAIENKDNDNILAGIKSEVREMCLQFPIPGV